MTIRTLYRVQCEGGCGRYLADTHAGWVGVVSPRDAAEFTSSHNAWQAARQAHWADVPPVSHPAHDYTVGSYRYHCDIAAGWCPEVWEARNRTLCPQCRVRLDVP